jgi:hypothetical protein
MALFAFNFGLELDGVGKKIVGENCLVEFTYTGGDALVMCVVNGFTESAADMAEIVNEAGETVTRFTATGAGTQKINISGLTPGTFVGIKQVSATAGTATARLLTGSSR